MLGKRHESLLCFKLETQSMAVVSSALLGRATTSAKVGFECCGRETITVALSTVLMSGASRLLGCYAEMLCY